MENKLIEKFYLAFFILLPLLFITTIVDSVLLPRQLFLGVFMLILIFLLFQKKIKISLFPLRSKIFLAIIGFLALNFISFNQSNVVSESHAVFSKLVLLFSFFTITTALLYNNSIREKKIVFYLVLFGLIALSTALYQIIEKTIRGQHLFRQIDIITGNFANKNLLASILFLCLPFYFIGLKEEKRIKYLSLFAILTTFFVLAIIRTRIALIACFVFIILLVCYKIKQQFQIKKRYFFVAGTTIAGLLFFVYKYFIENNYAKLPTTSSNITQQYFYRLLDSQTLKTRALFWENSLAMCKENTFFGVGLGNWQINFYKYGLNNFNAIDIVNGESTLQRPHNDFLWILCETGIFGLLAYLSIFAIVFYQLYFLIRKATTATEKWKSFYLFSALIGYILISFFDFPYERIDHQVVLMLIFAIVTSSYFKLVSTKKTNYKYALYFLLIPVLYSLLVTFYRINGEQHAVKMYRAKNNKNWSETLFEAKQTENYFYKLDNTSMPIKWYEGIGNFNANLIQESEACFYEAYQLNPYNVHVINNLASAYQVNGKSNEAIVLYNDALKISNNFDEAKLNLAALYFNKKAFVKAFSTINEVDVNSINPKYKTYLVPILNNQINTFLKSSTNKNQVKTIVKNINTKEKLLQLYFDSKKVNVAFDSYLATVRF